MQSSVATIRACPFVAKVSTQRPARRQQPVMAMAQDETTSRRAALAIAVGAVLGLTAEAAQAGGAPKNGYVASMSSFNMEGTKKQGISRKRKDKIIANLKKKIAAGGSASSQ